MKFFRWGGLLLSAYAVAQPALHLKTRDIREKDRRYAASVQATRRANPVRAHWLVQFTEQPTIDDVADLKQRGARVVSYVPDYAFIITAADDLDLDGLNISRLEQFSAFDKVSPALAEFAHGEFLVEFHADVDSEALEILSQSRVSRWEKLGLSDHQFLVKGTRADVRFLSSWDEVAYIFPADRDLAGGVPFHVCAGAQTTEGPVGQVAAKVGSWSPGENGPVALNFAYGPLTAKIDLAVLEEEIARALAEWSKYVRVDFHQTNTLNAPRTLAFRWGRGPNGGPMPFDGPGRMLAYTYYPSPPNPETLAGDLYFDDDENWRVGLDTDLFSVVLHEIGHALGLGHSDIPGSVMYPFYRKANGLTEDDIKSIRKLYIARVTEEPSTPNPVAPPSEPSPSSPETPDMPSTPTPAPSSDRTPPALAVFSPTTTILTTTQPSLNMRGTATDNVGVSAVTYTTAAGSTGTAGGTTNWQVQVPLLRGINMITIRAHDGAGNSSWRSLMVVRR